jgi:hypothetical protein
MVQRYPLISGFIDGNTNTFGWEFNPRLRIVTKDRLWPLTDKQEHVYWLEPGLRQVYVLLAVKDCLVEMKKKLFTLSEKNFDDILENKGPYTLETLRMEYIALRTQHPAAGCSPNTSLPPDDINQQFANFTRSPREEVKKKLISLHQAIVGTIGQQGKFKNTDNTLTFTVKRTWFNRNSGHLVQPESDVLATAVTNSSQSASPLGEISLVVSLPDKPDRTLTGLTPVLPERGSIDESTKVTIRGQNFSNDARVFIANQEATEVEVLGRDFLTATFPKIDKKLLEGDNEKVFSVTVLTGGDSLFHPRAFTYFAAKSEKPAPVAVEKVGPPTAKGGKLVKPRQ